MMEGNVQTIIIASLRGCKCTESNVEEYTCAVLGDISFCTENVTVKKHLKIFPNQKHA